MYAWSLSSLDIACRCRLSAWSPSEESGIQDLAAFVRYSSVVERSERQPNAKSDVPAKHAFCNWLRGRGYSDVRVTATPADVTANKDGDTWFFEVKFTEKESRSFGAATLTEWAAAAKDPDRFRFVIAYQRGGDWRFDCYTPEEFMAFSYVPPFKIYFNVPLDGRVAGSRTISSKRIHLTKARLRLLTEQLEDLRKLED